MSRDATEPPGTMTMTPERVTYEAFRSRTLHDPGIDQRADAPQYVPGHHHPFQGGMEGQALARRKGFPGPHEFQPGRRRSVWNPLDGRGTHGNQRSLTESGPA